MKHPDEGDLLELWYLPDDETSATARHLKGCPECAARLEAVGTKVRDAAELAVPEMHDTFWFRQSEQITRKIAATRKASSGSRQWLRVAAAWLLAFIMGGAVTYRAIAPTHSVATAKVPHVVGTTPGSTSDIASGAHDAWQNDELRDFHSVVEWESWIDAGSKDSL